MSGQQAADDGWTAWEVVPDSGFEVRGPSGRVGLDQMSPSEFLVSGAFRFSHERFQADIETKLTDGGVDEATAREMVDTARTYAATPTSTTDLASIPPFMRWFENTYGRHTLAAIIHDDLITDTVNGGALGSDTLADRFFRHMLQASGVPWLKRWIIWAAVALRSRWAAGGWRQASIVVWALLALVGTACFAVALGQVLADGEVTATRVSLVAVAVLLPAVAGLLWGEQWGASGVAAIAGIFVVPAAVFVVLGTIVYRLFEKVAAATGRT